MTLKKDMNTLICFSWIILVICLTAISCQAISSLISNHSMEPNANARSNIVLASSNDTPFRTDVLFGAFITRISLLSMKDSSFDADFYIWFKWKGNNVTPGEDIEIINGKTNSKVKQAEWHDGDNNYEQYKICAGIIKPFDVALFPFDNHNLIIEIEDSLNTIYWQQYVLEDPQYMNVGSEIEIPGYKTEYLRPIVGIHKYQTDFGSPWPDEMPSIYSQIRFGIGLVRDGWGVYFRLFQGLFVAVAVAMLTFFLRPDYAPRFIVGVGALFAAVANYYNMLSLQPIVNYVTLADIITLTGVVTILLSMISSLISYHMYHIKGKKNLSMWFDKYSVIVLVSCYIFINWWIIFVGTHSLLTSNII
jgi:hypothetical protein